MLQQRTLSRQVSEIFAIEYQNFLRILIVNMNFQGAEYLEYGPINRTVERGSPQTY